MTKHPLFKHLPNMLTLFRVAVFPALIVVMYFPGRLASFVAAILISLGAISDGLDGYYARKYNLESNLGRLLDPLADKIMISTGFIMLIHLERAPAWVVAVILAREIAVTGLRTLAAQGGLVISASSWGKQKTIAQLTALISLALYYPVFGIDPRWIGIPALYLALLMAIYSGWDYGYSFYRGLQNKTPGK